MFFLSLRKNKKYDPTFERVMAFQNLEVVHVVAMDQQHCIGKGNDLPWHISADLKHFKAITQGGVVIMGLIMNEKIGWREYDSLGMILIVLFVAVMVIEAISHALRKKLT
jgi:hypothetical protein